MLSTAHQKQSEQGAQVGAAPTPDQVQTAVSNGLMVDLLGLSSSSDGLDAVLDAWAREESDLGLGGDVPVEAVAEAAGVVEWGDVPEVAGPIESGLVDSLLDRIDRDNEDGSQVVVANTGGDMDLWTWVTGQEQVAGGIDAIVEEAIRNAGGGKIDRFEFKSHGGENWQRVAAGERLGPKDLTDKQREAFEELGKHMAEGGVIVLAGCNVAANFEEHLKDETSVLLQVAKAAQCTVTAGVAVQLPLDGIEGTQVTVQPDGTYTVDTSAGAWVYDQAADGAMELARWAVAKGAQVKQGAKDGADATKDLVNDGVDATKDLVDGAVDAVDAAVDAVTEWWAS